MINKIFTFEAPVYSTGNESRNTVIMLSTDVVLVFILTDQKNACEGNCNNVDLVLGDFNLDLTTAFPR